MKEYKCISCGAIKESEEPCGCPVCGYKMFETPYDRSEVLRKETRDFVSKFKLSELSFDLLDIFRQVPKKKSKDSDEDAFDIILKSTDDQRFPGFDKIQGYVCASEKTEEYFKRFEYSVEQIRTHINSPYIQYYKVSTARIKPEAERLDEALKEVLNELDIQIELPEIEISELALNYSETPERELLDTANQLLDSLGVLEGKVKKFIRQNNIYGFNSLKRPHKSYKISENGNYLEDLQKCSDHLSKIIAQKYVVDILSDGSDELKEMLKALWNTVEVIMTVPILDAKSTYTFEDGVTVYNDAVISELQKRICRRYSALDESIYAYDFLTEKTEDELFEIYNKMIDLDWFGFLGVKRSELITIGESEKKLNEMIGLSGIKESIRKIKAYALANKDDETLNVHMCFLGNPGSGKTEVARCIAGILYENKILPTKKVVEVDRSGLVSQYFGATAEKTSRVIASAMGGVLFIDEAYALGNNSDHEITDYGKEAIDTLVKAMEDHRGKFCVILAGYKNEMLQMLSTNPGFKSRIQFILDFPNYSREELTNITRLMLNSRHYTISDAAMSRILDITDVKRKEPNFANAREIRNILDQVIMCQNIRCMGTDDKELGLADVNKFIADAKLSLPAGGDGTERRILTGEEELDRLIGLSAVKRMIKKIKAYAKRNKGESDFNLHMCFYGNPGTGKTEVARILSRILYDAGVLGEAKMVETDGHGLLGRYVGETAPKTKAKINEAMNGVLFIDEAYGMIGTDNANGGSNTYGDEAIAVLLKEMEDHRGQFCVILAGYKSEMKNMLSANPGLESRIQFTLEFPDYSREELGEIAKAFLAKKGYGIADDALSKVLDVADYYRKRSNFANARTVRNVLDQVILNQNLRTDEEDSPDSIIIPEDVEAYLEDEKINLASHEPKTRIGF